MMPEALHELNNLIYKVKDPDLRSQFSNWILQNVGEVSCDYHASDRDLFQSKFGCLEHYDAATKMKLGSAVVEYAAIRSEQRDEYGQRHTFKVFVIKPRKRLIFQ